MIDKSSFTICQLTSHQAVGDFISKKFTLRSLVLRFCFVLENYIWGVNRWRSRTVLRHILVPGQNKVERQLVFIKLSMIKYNSQFCITPAQITMDAKTSELYLVFQNKAHHYKNLQTARSRVENHLSHSLNHTINVIEKQRYDRDFPVNLRYSIDNENKHMNNRITTINSTDQKVVLRDGSYSRYNNFERPFRIQNPFKNQEERLIELQNQKIKLKIERMRSGSRKYWESEFKAQQKFSKKRDGSGRKSSRGSLKIDAGQFLAKPYLEFINHMQNDKKKTLQDSKASSRSREKLNLEHEKLFVLPQFTSREQRLKRSKISLSELENKVDLDKQ